MQVTLNIGLDGVYGDSVLERATNAVREARGLGVYFVRTKLLDSDTEPTLVAEVHVDEPARTVATLSRILAQDCIACYFPHNGRGALYGPQADKWGDFNPEYFFTLEGQRLASQQQRAA